MNQLDPFQAWFAALQERHLANLTFTEARRALQALSSLYVQHRDKIPAGGAFDSAGKRAAFALFYGPIQFLQTRQLVCALGAARPTASRIFDLGAGTGAAGAAWALEMGGRPTLVAWDRHPWAVQETRWTYSTLGLSGYARRQELSRVRLAAKDAAILLAYTVNELGDQLRSRMLNSLLEAAQRGSAILVVEPVSRRVAPWWHDWSEIFLRLGGRADQWRFTPQLPEKLRLLDRAAGLDHRVLTCRSLWLPRQS